VSTRFRKSAEDHAKKHYNQYQIMDNEDSLENIINEYSGFRLRFLKYVHYYICFPIFKDDGCYESREELVERDEFSTEHIRRIFSGLKKMENRAGLRNRGSYRLTLQIHFVGNDYCAHRLHSQCRVHLLEPETLPRLVSVNSLYLLTEDSSQKLDYRILIDLALQVPNSKHLYYGARDTEPIFGYYDPPNLCHWYGYEERLGWGLAYHAPKVETCFDDEHEESNCEARQIWWRVGKWRPSDDVHPCSSKSVVRSMGKP
jgi:hypothetical protein